MTRTMTTTQGLLLAMALSAGCVTTINTHRRTDDMDRGIQYFLPKTLVALRITYTVVDKVKYQSGVPSDPTRTIVIEKPITVETRLHPDSRHPLMIDPEGGDAAMLETIKRSRRGVGPISLSEKWTWYLASLTISAKEFASLYTNDDVKWRRYTNNTLRLIDAAGFLAGYPGEDRRIDGILGKLTCDCYVNSSGITLLKRDNGDGYDIEEGNGRLAAICIHYLIRKANEPRVSEIDVVVGLPRVRA